jgi:ABC-type amino acid transport substrate-binding protein
MNLHGFAQSVKYYVPIAKYACNHWCFCASIGLSWARMSRRIRLACVLAGLVVTSVNTRAQTTVLRWGSDQEGSAPFIQADPRDASRLVGFDADIAALIAGDLGRRPEFHQISFSSLDQSVLRGDVDIALCGLENTPARRKMVPTSIPYYEFREVLKLPRSPERSPTKSWSRRLASWSSPMTTMSIRTVI